MSTQNKPKIISVFNNKGGVGKTTYLYHLAHLLAESGKKVLCVDCDSQCNLTAYFLPGLTLNGENNALKKAMYSKISIYDCVSGILGGEGININIKPLNVSNYTRENYLYLIPGSMNLSNFEDELGNTFGQAQAGGSLAITVQSALYRAIRGIAEKNDFDLVLLDVGPNLGALNRVLVGGSDYFIVPVSPDLFSIMGAYNLGERLKIWRSGWETINTAYKTSQFFRESSNIPSGKPKFLGYIIQNFTMSPAKNPAVAFQKFIDKFEPVFNESIIKPLAEYDQVALGIQNFNMGKIPDMATAVPTSMEYNCPMHKLTTILGGVPQAINGLHMVGHLEKSVNTIMRIIP